MNWWEWFSDHFRGEARSSAPAADAAMARYAQTGEPAAFVVVYDIMAPRITRYLQRQTRDRALTEDLLQATMLKVHERRGYYAPGAPVCGWIFAIARNNLRDERRRGRRCQVFDDHGDAPELADPAAISPGEWLENAEKSRAVRQAIARLSEAHRTLVEHVQYDGFTHAEIGEMHGLSIPAIKSRVHAAYEILRADLGQTLGGSP
jgi:RNA polymerase sigma-70 factor (ECF subfamily)